MSPSLLLLSLWVSLNLTPSLALIPPAKSPMIASSSSTNQLSRSMFFQWLGRVGIGTTLISPTLPAFAFDFGKIKSSQTGGVELWNADSTPIPNAQVFVSAEMASSSGHPILVTLQTPWLLSSVGNGLLQARDLRHSESLFVQVLALDPQKKEDQWQTPSQFRQLLLDSGVLSSQGNFKANESPTNVKVEALDDKTSTFQVILTLYTTPSMLQSEQRQLWITPKAIDKDTLVLLVVGTTRQRFASQQAGFQKVVESFTALAAPATRM
jgi:hypothetical protein